MSLTGVAFLLAMATCLVLAFVRTPVYGLYAYTAIFYLHPADRWWGSGLPDLRWHLLIAVLTLVATLRLPPSGQRPTWMRSPPAIYLLLMTSWLWVQNVWALDAELHLDVSILYTKYLVIFFLMYRLLDSEEAVWGFLRVHVLGCFYLGTLVLAAPSDGRLDGVGGPGIGEANALGMQLATGAMAAAALLSRGPLWSRGIGLLSAPLIANGIIQTESRGAFLATVLAGLVFLLMSPSRTRRLMVVAGLAGIIMVVPLIPANYWERIGSLGAVTEDEASIDKSAATRLVLARAQWQMFLDHPAGAGHRGTAALSPRYLSDEYLTAAPGEDPALKARSSHNTILTVLTEQGVPGILLFGVMTFSTWRTVRRLRRATREHPPDDPDLRLMTATTAAMITVWYVAGLFTDYFKAEIFVWSLALLASLDAGLTRTAIKQTADEPHRGPIRHSPRSGGVDQPA